MAGYYDSYESRSRRRHTGRSALGYWLPLAVTVTAATVGLAAWIWSERHEESDDDSDVDYERKRKGRRDTGHDQSRGRDEVVEPRPPPGYEAETSRDPSFVTRGEPRELQDVSTGVMARMSGAIRRTPSPQQILDEAGRRVAAGVAAAGAAVGGALSSIREESRDDYGDHSRWSEEADMRTAHGEAPRDQENRTATNIAGETSSTAREAGVKPKAADTSRSTAPHKSNLRRKTVAIVLSAEASGELHQVDPSDHHEDASILSHLPAHIDHERARLFVLIYGPDLKQHPLSTTTSTRPAGSVTSSFSNIAHDEAHTPGDEADKPLQSIDPEPIHSPFPDPDLPAAAKPTGTESSSFQAFYRQAQGLVEKDTMVLPFTTPSGHINLLRHLAPEVVYIQDSLSGDHGELVSQISGWVGQVVVVVGAEGGHGGLIDSEDEAGHGAEGMEKWWQQGDKVGLGKGIEVVDGMRIGEDWRRRVGGHE